MLREGLQRGQHHRIASSTSGATRRRWIRSNCSRPRAPRAPSASPGFSRRFTFWPTTPCVSGAVGCADRSRHRLLARQRRVPELLPRRSRTRTPVCAPPVCAAGFCTIGPADPLSGFPLPRRVHPRAGRRVLSRVRQMDLGARRTATFVATAAAPRRVMDTVDRQDHGGTFIPGPRISSGPGRESPDREGACWLRPTGHLHQREPVASGRRAAVLYRLLPGRRAAAGAGVLRRYAHGGAERRAQFNLRFADPTLDNNGVAQVDPMSGGYHRWFYGDWNGDQAFNDARSAWFRIPRRRTPSCSRRRRPSASRRGRISGPTPLWLGRGVGEFIGAARIHPGFTSAGSSTGNASNASSLRSSDTWNLDLKAQAA